MLRVLLVVGCFAIAACAPLPQAGTPDVLLLGEQHDARDHPRLHRDAVEALASAGRLAALALEMADEGRSTAGLPRDATPAQVREALGWDERGWPWARYEGAIMAAVRTGVLVAGANVPRARLRDAAADVSLDAAVSAPVMQSQREAVRSGHCGMLPEAQLTPMARMQVARDRAMARAAAGLVTPGKTVVLVTGAHHADPDVGVTLHLPPNLRTQVRIWPAEAAATDHCEQLRRHWK